MANPADVRSILKSLLAYEQLPLTKKYTGVCPLAERELIALGVFAPCRGL